MLKTTDFDYTLPAEKIAQKPLTNRDQSKLLVLNRQTGAIEHRTFADLIEYLKPGDIVVANNSRVLPARLFGRKENTGGKVEILLLEQHSPTQWGALIGGKKVAQGVQIRIHDLDDQPTEIIGSISKVLSGPQREIIFNVPSDEWLSAMGHTPLPPYIHERLEDGDRYQTIYARPPGSAAAPTAGMHFTPELMLALRDKGVLFESITLHIGLDTFKPVTAEQITNHTIHSEWARLTPDTAKRINEAKLAGGRLVAVGTTSVRTLETAALRSAGLLGSLQSISQQDLTSETAADCPWKPVAAFEGQTDLFINPGYKFRVVDRLITNFHIPQSTLLMLVSAFAGRDKMMSAYQTALEHNYRFLSFGDAMLIKDSG